MRRYRLWARLVNEQTSDNLNSPFSEQRKQGFRWLRFADFVEEEFLAQYTRSSLARSRWLPMIALAASLIGLGTLLMNESTHLLALLFNAAVMVPVLSLTIWASLNPSRYRLYQLMIVASTMLIGMYLTSYVTRGSIEGQSYYFSALVAWVFMVWLMLGLPFRHAAFTALTISALAVFGILGWNVPFREGTFNIMLLVFVNCIGAFCCYQLEYAVRHAFLESKVLGQLAERDGLTGLYNRRSYDAYLKRIWRQSKREQTQITLLLIDIDYFKAYNDHYGHQAGDDAMKEVAGLISLSAQRPLDFAARFGGEEFALILYGPENQYGVEIAEQLRESVQALKIPHEDSEADQYLTVSIGVAQILPDSSRSLPGAIQLADEALYQAKEEGRNRVAFKASDSQIQTGRFRVKRLNTVT